MEVNTAFLVKSILTGLLNSRKSVTTTGGIITLVLCYRTENCKISDSAKIQCTFLVPERCMVTMNLYGQSLAFGKSGYFTPVMGSNMDKPLEVPNQRLPWLSSSRYE